MVGAHDEAIGGQSQETVVSALIEASFDRHQAVSKSICSSLYVLGKREPGLFLGTCLSFLRREGHAKVTAEQKNHLLALMGRVCREAIANVDQDIRKLLLSHCVEDMSSKKSGGQNETNQLCSDIVVALGMKSPSQVMDLLFTKFQPSSLPGFYVVKTLGDLAAANPFGMVPYLKALLGTMLPMLGMAKSDDSRWVFAYTLSRFCDSILEYIANIEKAPDSGVTKDYFNSEISAAFDVLFANWFQSRDQRLREQVVQALGLMSSLLNKAKFEEIAPKLIAGLLTMYGKRQALAMAMTGKDLQLHIVTQSFCQVLEANMAHSSAAVQVQMDNVLSTLFNQVCAFTDFSQPAAKRNHNELLRCFATLTGKYCDLVIPFLLPRFDSGSVAVKVGALTVIKHLVNACKEQVQSKMPSIFFALRLLLNDESNKVRQLVAQVIVAVAHHGYLDMEGGQLLIQFIVRQCALPPKEPTNDSTRRQSFPDSEVTNEQLKSMCENVMHLLVTTVESVEKVLWPHLFEYLVSPEYSTSLPIVCKALTVLGEKLKGDVSCASDFDIDFTRYSMAPKPPALMARFCVLIGSKSNEALVLPVLKLMKVISPLIDKSLTPLWDTIVSQLTTSLEAGTGLKESLTWQTECLAFVNQSLIEVDKQEFTLKFGKSLVSQMHLYNDSPENKQFLLFLLGNVIRRLGSKHFTADTVDVLFERVDHGNELERIGCAYVMGQSSAAHLDLVLVKLEQFAEAKKGGNILSIFMDSVRNSASASEQEKVRATVMLSYGQATRYASPQLLVTRIETPILRTLASYYEASRDPLVKRCFIEAVTMIADSVHPQSLKLPYLLRSRNELMSEMMIVLKTQNVSEQNAKLAVDAISTLIKLDPILNIKEKTNVIETVAKVSLSSYNNEYLLKAKENLMNQLLIRDKFSTDCLELMVKSIRKWLTSKLECERENAIEAMSNILHLYYNGITFGEFKNFEPLPLLLALFIPRTSDPILQVRYKAFDCLRLTCLISDKLHSRSSENDLCIHSLERLAEVCAARDSPNAFDLNSQDLAKCLAQRLQLENCLLTPFLQTLSESLSEPHAESSRGTCLVINGFLTLKGDQMKQDVPQLVELLHNKIPFISCDETREGVFQALRSLAGHHLSTVATHLLTYSLPWDEVTVEFWRVIAQDKSLCTPLTEFLLDIVTGSNVVETHTDLRLPKKSVIIANCKTLAAICGLREVFNTSEAEGVTRKLYDKILTCLLMATASYLDAVYVSPENGTDKSRRGSTTSGNMSTSSSGSIQIKPVKCSTEALKTFLVCAKQSNVLTDMTPKGWGDIESPVHFPDAVATLAKAICVHCDSQIPSLVNSLTKTLNNSNANQRLVPVVFFSQLLSHRFKDETTLTEPLINTLLNMLNDPSPVVRKLAIRGLGQLGQISDELVPKFTTTVISAILTGIDDKDSAEGDMTREALNALSNLVDKIEYDDISKHLVTITMRLRTLFDQENPVIRATAISIFGRLARFFDEQDKDSLKQSFSNSLIPLLIYLNDIDAEVVKACKSTLKRIGGFVGPAGFGELCKKALSEESSLHYGEFVNTFSKLLIKETTETVDNHISTAVSYLKSEPTVIQCNSIVLIGFLLGNHPESKRNKQMKERATASLVLLLRESPNPEVRIKSAEALCIM